MKILKYILFTLFVVIYAYSFAQFGDRNMLETSNTGITQIITADINNDGFNDIIVAQKYGYDRLAYYLNMGDGNFASPISFKTFNDPKTISASDFDKDGWVDFVSASYTTASIDTLFIFFNNHDNSFTEFPIDTQVDMVDKVVSIQNADVDNDNDIDIVLITDLAIIVYYNQGENSFVKEIVAPGLSTEYYTFSMSDINNDGFVDIIAGAIKSLVYMNDAGVFSFDSQRTNSIVNSGLVLVTELNDFDGDGDNDLIIDGGNNTDLRWYANDGNGFFSLAQVFQTNIQQPRDLLSRDFNLDDRPDVFTCFPQSGKVVWYENLGGGNFSSENIIYTGSSPFPGMVASSDLNNDGKYDIIWADELSYHFNDFTVNVVDEKNNTRHIFYNSLTKTINVNPGIKGKLIIYNTLGQLIYVQNVNEGNCSVLLDLKPNIYIISMQMKGNSINKKIIVN